MAGVAVLGGLYAGGSALMQMGFSLEEWDHFSGTVASFATTVGVFGAGLWAFFQYVWHREGLSKLDVTADIEIIGLQGDFLLGVVSARVNNAGRSRHYVKDLFFDLRTLNVGDTLETLPKTNNLVSFPHKLYDRQRFFPASWEWSFVEPGCTNVYRHTVALPLETRYVIVKVKLPLPGQDEFFTSWKVIPASTLEGRPG